MQWRPRDRRLFCSFSRRQAFSGFFQPLDFQEKVLPVSLCLDCPIWLSASLSGFSSCVLCLVRVPGASRPVRLLWAMVMLQGNVCVLALSLEQGDVSRSRLARVVLVENFKLWLNEQGIDFQIFLAQPPDLDRINAVLTQFGRFLFGAGKPYYHFSELINGIVTIRPTLRRSLQQAWDLAFLWGSYEPSEHHIAVPHQVLLLWLRFELMRLISINKLGYNPANLVYRRLSTDNFMTLECQVVR